MITNLEEAFEIIEYTEEGIPFEAIEYLYNHEPDERIVNKIKYFLDNAYNDDLLLDEGYELEVPLWYAIVAENHHTPLLIDSVIGLFTTTVEDWDFLTEQGEYLVGVLSEKYPDQTIPKILEIIDNLSDQDSDLPYLYLFDALYFANVEEIKPIILKILSKESFTWYYTFVILVADLQIKEALPILKQKYDECLSEGKSILENHLIVELEEAIEELEQGFSKYHELVKPYYKDRGNWKDHYKNLEYYFFAEEDEDEYIDDYEDEDEYFNDYDEEEILSNHEEKKQKKVGRNDPCPCGSGLKFKKCCIGKGIYD